MSSIRVSKETTAAPEALWMVVVGIDDWVDVVEAIEVVKRLDDGDGFGLGTTWRETRTMFGKQATEDIEVTEYEEGVRYATTAES
ncbi:SRPBCC family protein, partial [bacterium]|nr:SRPBCC family protein [bacterium]